MWSQHIDFHDSLDWDGYEALADLVPKQYKSGLLRA